MKSIGTMIKHLQGLVGVVRLNNAELQTIVHISDLTQEGRFPERLDRIQLNNVNCIYNLHCGDAEAT